MLWGQEGGGRQEVCRVGRPKGGVGGGGRRRRLQHTVVAALQVVQALQRGLRRAEATAGAARAGGGWWWENKSGPSSPQAGRDTTFPFLTLQHVPKIPGIVGVFSTRKVRRGTFWSMSGVASRPGATLGIRLCRGDAVSCSAHPREMSGPPPPLGFMPNLACPHMTPQITRCFYLRPGEGRPTHPLRRYPDSPLGQGFFEGWNPGAPGGQVGGGFFSVLAHWEFLWNPPKMGPRRIHLPIKLPCVRSKGGVHCFGVAEMHCSTHPVGRLSKSHQPPLAFPRKHSTALGPGTKLFTTFIATIEHCPFARKSIGNHRKLFCSYHRKLFEVKAREYGWPTPWVLPSVQNQYAMISNCCVFCKDDGDLLCGDVTQPSLRA